jgi:hypothetical protein
VIAKVRAKPSRRAPDFAFWEDRQASLQDWTRNIVIPNCALGHPRNLILPPFPHKDLALSMLGLYVSMPRFIP